MLTIHLNLKNSFLIPWSFDLNYIGGNIFLTHPDRGVTEVSFNGVYGNPPINFDPSIGASPNVLITSLSTSNAQPIDSQYFQDSANFPVQELILTQDLSDAVCSSLREPGNPINPVFATFEGQYWMHDPRFVSFNVNVLLLAVKIIYCDATSTLGKRDHT